jgi:hypothetical protein
MTCMESVPTFNQLQTRTTTSIVTFLACCLLSSAGLVYDAPNPRHPPGDIARRSDLRFAALKSALPVTGVVGYIGEPGTPALADYYLAQYALAPLVLDQSPSHRLVVGNYPNQSPPPAAPGLSGARDFGNGVFLFSNKFFAKEDEQ